jgi:hypothetical protein
LRIWDCGLEEIESAAALVVFQSAIRNPQSAIQNKCLIKS